MLSVEYNEYFCGEIPESNGLESLIDELINQVELEDITNRIKLFADEKGIKLCKTRLQEMENFIQLLINDIDRDKYINGKKITFLPIVTSLCGKHISNFEMGQELNLITLKLIFKYIDFFYKLHNNNNLELTTETIRSIVSKLINSNSEIFNISSEMYFYKFYQTGHGDLVIYKYEKDTQIDMFYSDENQRNTAVVDEKNLPTEELHIFQTLDGLYTSLLEYCYKNNFIPKELEGLQSIKGTIPNAGDAMDFSKSSNNSFINRLENNDTPSPIIRNYHYGDTFTHVKHTKEGILLSIEDKNTETKYFTINKEEIGVILLGLHNKPCRSIVQIHHYLNIFLNKLHKDS